MLAVAALAAAVISVVVLVHGSSTYVVHARFTDASQLVKGDRVQVSGQEAGEVTDVQLASDGQAEITLHINSDYAPLREGTTASVRLRSLLGVANRYVDLKLPPDGARKLPSGTVLDTDHTQSAVDFDIVLDLLTPKVRKSLQRVIAGSAEQFNGQGMTANEGLMYLAPALSTTDAVVAELARDKPRLTRFITRGNDLAGDIASERAHVTGLIQHLASTGSALADQQTALKQTVAGLPGFMDQGKTTFARLRESLTVLRPLVDESKPAVRRLGPFLTDLRTFSTDARPTIRDLARTVSTPGANNDLYDLINGAPALRDIATATKTRNGKRRPGAFPVTTSALKQAIPELTFARPYAVDLTGWFNDFGTSGVYDALGGESRASTSAGAFQLLGGTLFPIPPDLRAEAFQRTALLGYDSRCPGADERDPGDHSTPYAPPGVTCDPKQVPPGP